MTILAPPLSQNHFPGDRKFTILVEGFIVYLIMNSGVQDYRYMGVEKKILKHHMHLYIYIYNNVWLILPRPGAKTSTPREWNLQFW